jgi:hypothetical protein
MKAELSQSPLSSAYLRQYPKRFERIIGLSVENVDDLVRRISQQRLEKLLSTHVLWDAERTRRMHECSSRDH